MKNKTIKSNLNFIRLSKEEQKSTTGGQIVGLLLLPYCFNTLVTAPPIIVDSNCDGYSCNGGYWSY